MNPLRLVYARDWSPALFLSSICATWRKIAFSTSEIWRFINIPPLKNEANINIKIELLNECVGRAAQRSLCIGVFQSQLNAELLRCSELEEKLNALIPLFYAIKDVARRSEEITLSCLPPYALQLILSQDIPNLRAVRIAEAFLDFMNDDDDDDDPVWWTMARSTWKAQSSAILILKVHAHYSLAVVFHGTTSPL
jgi:hypothetical protein